jgi:hypothetical protein
MTPQTTILEDGTEVTLIHFLCETKDGLRLACTPNLEVLCASRIRHIPHMRSEEITAVTCPICKRTNEFKHAETEAKHAFYKYQATQGR